MTPKPKIKPGKGFALDGCLEPHSIFKVRQLKSDMPVIILPTTEYRRLKGEKFNDLNLKQINQISKIISQCFNTHFGLSYGHLSNRISESIAHYLATQKQRKKK